MEFLDNMLEVLQVDAGVKNRFKYEWLSSQDCHGELLMNYIRKSKEPGAAFCLYCSDFINYGSGGIQCITRHAKSKKHSIFRTLKRVTTQKPDESNSDNCNASTASNLPSIPIADRRTNTEATILSFVAEHNLGLPMIPALLDFAKEMARDQSALSSLQMSRQCGTYKITDGLAPALRQKLVHDLHRYHFSLSLDVGNSNAGKRILIALVSYYSEEAERVVVQHYLSAELKAANAESVVEIVTEAFEKDKIPQVNMVSVLADSKREIETLFRERFSHLLDVGGETRREIENIVEQFCSHFGGHLEELLDDTSLDLEYSPELENHLMDICEALETAFQKPRQRQAHKSLSVYDCLPPFRQMLSALTLLYWAWLPVEKCSMDMQKLYHELLPSSEGGRRVIQDVYTECKQGDFQSDGQERKSRIAKKLLTERSKTLLILNLYTSVLKRFKTYIEFFQKEEPMMHRIFDKQQELLKWFLACFMYSEEVNKHKRHLKKVNVKDHSLHLPNNDLHMGAKAGELYKSLEGQNEIQEEFSSSLKQAYVATGEYMQRKFCRNKVVKQLSALDPKACGYTLTHVKLTGLLDSFNHALSEDQQDEYEREARTMQVARKLPKFEENMRIDEWWTLIFHGQEYPNLSHIVKMCLSIFTFSQVEQSFSQNGSLGTASTNKMDTKTVAALQTIRYYLKTKETPQKRKSTTGETVRSRSKEKESVCLKVFHRDDVRKDPVDSLVCRHLLKAHVTYTTDKGQKALEKQKSKQENSTSTIPKRPDTGGTSSIHDHPSKKKRTEHLSAVNGGLMVKIIRPFESVTSAVPPLHETLSESSSSTNVPVKSSVNVTQHGMDNHAGDQGTNTPRTEARTCGTDNHEGNMYTETPRAETRKDGTDNRAGNMYTETPRTKTRKDGTNNCAGNTYTETLRTETRKDGTDNREGNIYTETPRTETSNTVSNPGHPGPDHTRKTQPDNDLGFGFIECERCRRILSTFTDSEKNTASSYATTPRLCRYCRAEVIESPTLKAKDRAQKKDCENTDCSLCVKGYVEEHELLNHLALLHRYDGSFSESDSD